MMLLNPITFDWCWKKKVGLELPVEEGVAGVEGEVSVEGEGRDERKNIRQMWKRDEDM